MYIVNEQKGRTKGAHMNILSSLLYFILEKIALLTTKVDAVPHIFVSTADPAAADGEDGDLWFKYNA